MRLPNLDVMVAFTEVRKSVMAVAIAPISKLKLLAEWGDEDRRKERIWVRGALNGKTVDILLPETSFTLPAPLQALVGYERYKRGQHPLKRQALLESVGQA